MARFTHATLGMTAALALTTACSTEGAGQATSGGTGEGGAQAGSTGGLGGGATTTTTTTTTSSIASVTGAGGFGGSGGGAPWMCDPPAPAGSLWALSAESWPMLDDTSMCKYRGEVTLIVNTAAI